MMATKNITVRAGEIIFS